MNDISVSLNDLAMSLSSLIDLVSTDLTGHHKRVAYISLQLSKKLGIKSNQQGDILLAALLHDTGALSFSEDPGDLKFDSDNPHRHAELGFRLLSGFNLFKGAAKIIRYDHQPWKGSGISMRHGEIPVGSYILHLADSVDQLIDHSSYILGQNSDIRQIIKSLGGASLHPSIVEAFMEVSDTEAFWLDIVHISNSIGRYLDLGELSIKSEVLLDAVHLFKKLIDSRSPFTAAHSSGVAAVAEQLAVCMNFTSLECRMMMIAGQLHDIGKMAVPSQILDKPSRLSKEEVQIIRSHTYHTYQILQGIRGFETINTWASLHHETLNGQGYPFHLSADQLPLGTRILSVADIFTAVMEDRPYRKGMSPLGALSILESMAANGSIDGNVVSALKDNFRVIDNARIWAQYEAEKDYEGFLAVG